MNPLDDFEQLAAEARNETPPEIDVTDAVIQRVGDLSVDSAPAELQPARRRLIGTMARWTVVATLLLGVAIWWQNSGPIQALAAVEQALAAMSEPADRTYSIQVEVGGPFGPSRKREGTLHLRGRDQLLLRMDGPLGSEILAGSDGSESWVMPPIGPVLISSNPHQFEDWLSRHHGPAPLLRIDNVLQRLTEGYDLADAQDARETRHIIATRRESTDARRPDTVHLWMAPSNGTVQRLEVDWNNDRAIPGPRHISVQLSSEQKLPDAFFQHEHHAGDRVVRTLPGQ